MSGTILERPAHVPAYLVREFDFYRIPGDSVDVHAAWKRVQQENPDIFWTPCHGGMWVTTRAEDIEYMQIHYETFSMKAHGIPRNLSPNLPLELDPPDHGPIRAILNPMFTPQAVRKIETAIREMTISLIESFKPNGRCEFVSEFGRQLPINLFLHLVDLPTDDRLMLLELAEIRVRGGEAVKREGAKRALLAYLRDVILKRRENPGSDVLSRIVTASVNGELIAMETAQNLLSVVMFGGLDTVATMMAFIGRFLALDPALRRRLSDNPDQIPKAIDEMLRRHGITTSGRLVVHDVEYKGVKMLKDDIVLVPAAMHGLDERRFPNPMEIEIDRPNASAMATFGNGSHRCPGATLGKMEIRIFLEEWLRRMPDFDLDPEDPPRMASGMVSAILRLPLTWTV
jgi:cytochrome P450